MTVRANNVVQQASSSSLSSFPSSPATATSSCNANFSNSAQGNGNSSICNTSWAPSHTHFGIMVQCFASGDGGRRGSAPYIRRIEKVKFGVPVSEAFSHDIPATLLVLMLKVNKQGPSKRDIWRAPGNQAHVRKLIHVMQHGRLVNIENFSVYTAASVIKKFLTKIPGGIFGPVNEERLFELLNFDDPDKQREAFCRVVSSLPVPSQHLLVLLIGTFRLIADSAESCGLRMSPDAIGVSVAPSLFHSCILDGQRAKMEDIARFHMASKVLSFLVQSFGFTNLFPRDNYEFYARITGRTLRVDENWHFTFQYPSRAFSQPDVVVTPEHDVAADESFRRLANSAELTTTAVSLDELKRINKLAESTKSLSYLEWVHERQTQRMQSRSEWFLSPDQPTDQKQVSTSSAIASVSSSNPAGEASPAYPFFSDRHGSLPASGGIGYDEPGPSTAAPRPSLPYRPSSPLQYYRYHNYNPHQRQRAGSASAGPRGVSGSVHVHLSPVSKLQPLPDSNGHNKSGGSEASASGSTSPGPKSPPDPMEAVSIIERRSWRCHYGGSQEGATGSTTVEMETRSGRMKKTP